MHGYPETQETEQRSPDNGRANTRNQPHGCLIRREDAAREDKAERTRLDPKKGFLLQENATGRKSRRRMGQHVTNRNEPGGCAAKQVRQPGYESSVL
jgi:hypothetical protein